MKKHLIKGLFYATLVIMGGCSKELNTVPTQTVDATTALKTSDDVKAALIGSYADMGSQYLFGGAIFLEADLLANTNQLNWSGTYQQLTQINTKTIPVDNSYVASNWLSGYTAINDANNVLSTVSVVDAADSASVAGQAKFISAFTYFELVKMFAKDWHDGSPATNLGVPLVLTPTTVISAKSKVKRNTVAEVYAQVINDLTTAEQSLPLSNGFYADKGAAAAILARVYLQQGDFVNAVQAANRAITESGAKLAPTYAAAFNTLGNTSEDIFAIQVTPTSGIQNLNTFYSSSQRGDVQINPPMLAMFEPGDDRKTLFYSDNGSTYTGKFEQLYGNVHTVRLAEMLLVRAECNFRLGTAVGAAPADDINAIRNRALLPSYTAAQLTLDEILKERMLELAFEGFSLDDIKRLQQNVNNLPWNSPKLIFPIPKREIIANANLQQNEGY